MSQNVQATANEQGSRLLANVSVAAAVEAERADRLNRLGITADRCPKMSHAGGGKRQSKFPMVSDVAVCKKK